MTMHRDGWSGGPMSYALASETSYEISPVLQEVETA
jgi:hypothetical protein